MKAQATPHAVPERPARLEFKVRFSQTRGKGRRPMRIRATAVPASTAATASGDNEAGRILEVDPAQVPKLTRLLVLGHHFERLVRDGVVRDYAEIARLTGLSRTRVTQLLNLTLLSRDLQTLILLPCKTKVGLRTVPESDIRKAAAMPLWTDQHGLLSPCG